MGLRAATKRILGKLAFRAVSWASLADDRWFGLVGNTTDSGVMVSADSALSSTAVLDAVRTIAETVAKTPLILYRRLAEPGGGSERAPEHDLYDILRYEPNPEMTAVEFWEAMMAQALLRGNAYAEIERARDGSPLALWPLWTQFMKVRRVGGEIVYEYNQPRDAYGTAAIDAELPDANVFRLRGFSTGGLVGLDTIAQCRNAVGLTLALEKFAAYVFRNGAAISGAVESPGALTEEQYKRMRSELDAQHSGLTRAHRLMILEKGMQFKSAGMDNEAAQMIESRTFSVLEVARLFHVPPHKLAELTRATFSNIEHQALEFLQETLEPWFVRIEQRIRRGLLTAEEKQEYYAEFLRAAILRADTLSRYRAYEIAIRSRFMTPNEARAMENMNPREGGDELSNPNITPAPLAAPNEPGSGDELNPGGQDNETQPRE